MPSIVAPCDYYCAADIKPPACGKPHASAQSVRPGRRGLGERPMMPKRALPKRWVFGSARFLTTMIGVDENDREFWERWAKSLNVSLGVLILRIVEATIDGDQYIKMRPRDD